MKQLSALTEERKVLKERLKNFNKELKEKAHTGKVAITVDGKRLVFLFDNGKCEDAPPNYGWAKGWPLVEMKKFAAGHRYPFQVMV